MQMKPKRVLELYNQNRLIQTVDVSNMTSWELQNALHAYGKEGFFCMFNIEYEGVAYSVPVGPETMEDDDYDGSRLLVARLLVGLFWGSVITAAMVGLCYLAVKVLG